MGLASVVVDTSRVGVPGVMLLVFIVHTPRLPAASDRIMENASDPLPGFSVRSITQRPSAYALRLRPGVDRPAPPVESTRSKMRTAAGPVVVAKSPQVQCMPLPLKLASVTSAVRARAPAASAAATNA